jgi:hypothetical protein
MLQVRPFDVEIESTRLTTPVNPPCGVIVIVEVAGAPGVAAEGELAVIVKFTKLKVALAVRVRAGEFIVPVIDSTKLPAFFELHDTVAV